MFLNMFFCVVKYVKNIMILNLIYITLGIQKTIQSFIQKLIYYVNIKKQTQTKN